MSIKKEGDRIFITILGEATSKANSRQMVPAKSKSTGKVFMRPIKSQKAIGFLDAVQRQIILQADEDLLTGELTAHIWMYYANHRSDLDESLVLDVLQGRAYKNDRQVRERHVYHFIDKEKPRVEIMLEPRRIAGAS